MEGVRQECAAVRAALAAKEEELAAEERYVTLMRDELRAIEQEMRAVESKDAVETSNAPVTGSAVVGGSAAEGEDAHPVADVQHEEGGLEAAESGVEVRRKTRSAHTPTAAGGYTFVGICNGIFRVVLFFCCLFH